MVCMCWRRWRLRWLTKTEVDLSEANSLQDADQSLYSAIFGYCLEHGLTEDERALVARTFTDASRISGGEGGHV